MVAWPIFRKELLLRLLDEGLFALSIATLCYIFLFAMQPFLFLGDVGLVVQDRVFQFRADTRASETVPPFVVLDIDDTNYRRLGYPSITPHRLISELLEISASGGPRLIILDIEIGWRDNEADDSTLSYTLKKIADSGGPPVLLVRQPFRKRNDDSPTIVRPTQFDQIVEGSRNLSWVTSLTPIDGDGVTRRLLPGQNVIRECSTAPELEEVTPVKTVGDLATHRKVSVVPITNVQVAACAALEGNLERLKLKLKPNQRCDHESNMISMLRVKEPVEIMCVEKLWPLIAGAEHSSRIIYNMRWRLPDGHSRPQMSVATNDMQVQEIEVLSAVDLVAHAREFDPIGQFGGRIVIIGSSALDIGDSYRSPIGVMPGFMVIANAIRSGGENGHVPATPGYLSGLLVTVVMTAFTFVLWLGCRRLPTFGVPLFKFAAIILGTLLWFFVATWALSSGHVIAFVFPQYLVITYLFIAVSPQSAF